MPNICSFILFLISEYNNIQAIIATVKSVPPKSPCNNTKIVQFLTVLMEELIAYAIIYF